MDYKGIQEIIKAVSESKLTYFEVNADGNHIIMKKEIIEKALVQSLSDEIKKTEAEDSPMLAPRTFVNTESSLVLKNSEAEVSPNHERKESSRQENRNTVIVTSPIVGTLYTASSPDSESFVKVGSKVKKGDVLCIIEAMKLMNEIECEHDGEIVEIFADNEQMVEFGQPLFKIVL